MKIELQKLTIRDISNGYVDNEDEGVKAYGGQLDIRPPYQREFIYKEKERDAVITTIKNNFPLNVMYWAKRDDGTFEIIDGQQRTISFCQYVNGDFAYNFKYFHNLTDVEKNEILDYELMIYICEGTDKEKLDWFRVINIAGEKLTDQELRNAVYSGTFVSDAKRYFSKNNCPAYKLGKEYILGTPIRQDYLEKAIEWLAAANKMGIEDYMALHQHDPNANHLWMYFNSMITWVKTTFPKYRKEMKGVKWGLLYNTFKDKSFNTIELENEIKRLMADDDVTNKKGIYTYVLTREEKHLNIRDFTESQKRSVYEQQFGICPICNGHFEFEQMEGDHIVPWHKGGKTLIENLQMLCIPCNRKKSGK